MQEQSVKGKVGPDFPLFKEKGAKNNKDPIE
jgi:hypothetical protein